MARIKCPQNCREGYHHSSGDGWDEWDECRCCNPDGNNDSGTVSKKRLADYNAECAAEEARVNEHIRLWEAEMRQPCPECGALKIDHYSRQGEPCKTIEEFNREYAASKISANP